MNKNILVIGIVFILLFATTPTMLGQTIQKENQTLNKTNITNSGDAKPDFKVVDVDVYYDEWGWPYFNIFIENSGASVTWNGECSFTFYRLFKNEALLGNSNEWNTAKHHPAGATLQLGAFVDVEYLNFYVHRVYFFVDPNNNVDELNEENNVVWTYAFVWWRAPLPRDMYSIVILGSLRQGHLPVDISQQSTIQSNVLLQGTETTNK